MGPTIQMKDNAVIASKNVEKLENSAVKLSITIGKDDTTKEYNGLLKEYTKEVQIKGFRKGKVPASILERKFGEGIRQEAAANIMDKALNEAIEQIEEKPLGYAYPEIQGNPKLVPGEDFSFEVTYDVFPEIKLGEYKGLEIEEKEVEILKEHEDAELKKIQKQNSVTMDKEDETVAKGNIVTIDYCEMEGDTESEGTKREDFVFTIGTGYNLYKIDDDLVGMKKNEEKIITKNYDEDFDPPALAGRSVVLKVKVKEVKEEQLPPLDDELAQDVNEDFKTLDDLRQDVKKQLQDKADEKIEYEKIQQILDKLVETSDITLPLSMVNAEQESNWRYFLQQSYSTEEMMLKLLAQKGQTKEDMLASWEEEAGKSVKTKLILNRIIKDEKIEVPGEELDEAIARQAEMYGMPIENLKKLFKGEHLEESIEGDLKRKKVLDFLLENAKIKKNAEKVNFNDLMG